MQDFSMKDIFPLIEEGIANGGKYRFYPKGTSMLPLIREGKDSVVFSQCDKVERYDLVLYERADGSFVLHRVVKVDRDGFSMCGDNQCVLEKGIKSSQIKAKVSGIYRDDKLIDLNYPDYLKYVKRRVSSIPIRRLKATVKAVIRKIKE